jgi:hypothetical protein
MSFFSEQLQNIKISSLRPYLTYFYTDEKNTSQSMNMMRRLFTAADEKYISATKKIYI